MGNLILRSVEYIGDKYSFISPEFENGLNIIEGPNGSGKSTFIELIYFCLGGSVSRFSSNDNEFHREICSDTNNSVKIKIEINEVLYLLHRYFAKNEILVIGNEDDVSVFPVYRSGDKETFSDWILRKLGIEIFDLYQGNKHGKLSFIDLMRLMYYDQKTTPSRIYKDPDNNNFVTNSLEYRRAIFEILIGGGFQEYYSLYSQLKESQKELDFEQSGLRQFVAFLAELDIGDIDKNSEAVAREFQEISSQYDKLLKYKQVISNHVIEEKKIDEQFSDLNRELYTIRSNIEETTAKRNNLVKRLTQFHESILFINDEVKKIAKLIHVHESLGIYTPNICPICLRDIVREDGHCICGSPIDEKAYEKFFYNSEEYQELLKQKRQNLETITDARIEVESQLEEIDKTRDLLILQENSILAKLNGFVELTKVGSVESEVSAISEKAYLLRERMLTLENYSKFEDKRQKKETAVSTLTSTVEKIETLLNASLAKAQVQLEKNIECFTMAYEKMMTKVVDSCRSVRLTTSYMPVINNGESMPASFDVQKRFLYYVSLFCLRNKQHDLAFPGFMLFDTPENLGIDLLSLNALITELNHSMSTENTKAQVILTTGEKKYPLDLASKVKIVLSKERRLLSTQSATSTNEGTSL